MSTARNALGEFLIWLAITVATASWYVADFGHWLKGTK
jgi:hypothetical protein